MRSNFQELDIYLCNWMTWYWFNLVYQVSRTCSHGDISNQVKTTTRVYNVFRQSPMRFPSPTENFPIGLIEFLLLDITSGTKIWIFHRAWILKSKSFIWFFILLILLILYFLFFVLLMFCCFVYVNRKDRKISRRYFS